MCPTICEARSGTNHHTEIQDTPGAPVPNYVSIPGDSDDARAVRTRDALAMALYALMRERTYEEITVQEICERATVGRSTFYAHFQDKNDILMRHAIEFARSFGHELSWDGARGYRFPVCAFFEHVRDMRHVFDSLAKARQRDFIIKVCQNNFAEVFERRIRELRGGARASVPADILAQHLAGTLMTLLTWWSDHHRPLDAEEMEEQWGRLVGGLR
jgi:AcrR family transcriptional regulator